MKDEINYGQTLKKFIVEHFLLGEENGFQEDSNFFENGIVDSTGILEIVSFLEGTYSFTIEDKELIPENFSSLKTIENYLIRKLGGNTP